MALRNTASEFGSLAKSLHWLVAAGIFALVYLGLQQAGLERGPEKTEIRFIHGPIALTVFFLMTLRIVWRLMNETSAQPEGTPAWQRLTAVVVHWGLYAAIYHHIIAKNDVLRRMTVGLR